MRPVAPMFKLYRFVDDDGVWWRMLSPNGRGIARATIAQPTHADSLAAIALLVESMDLLRAAMYTTDRFRWRWVLTLEDEPVALGVGDQDRRVRCEQAWRKFVLNAPLASIDPTVHAHRRGTSSVARTPALSRRR